VKTVEERFWEKVKKGIGDECWQWIGARSRHGYGNFGIRPGRTARAHRFSYEQERGPIPVGLMVLHRCDNRLCVNPEHLFIGTQIDNMRDMVLKGRRGFVRLPKESQPRGEKHGGSKLTASDVIEIRRRRDGGERYVRLAEAFGVTSGQIRAIAKRENWSHI
jgi:hypothetical protein